MERIDWWKNFRQNDGKILLWTIFLNICKNNGQLLRSVVAENVRTSHTAATNLLPRQEGAPQTYLTWRQIASKTITHRSSDVCITWDDLREITSQLCEETTRTGTVRSKLYQLFAIKINLSWYPVLSKLVSYTCEHRRLTAYYQYQKLRILISICWSYLKI